MTNEVRPFMTIRKILVTGLAVVLAAGLIGCGLFGGKKPESKPEVAEIVDPNYPVRVGEALVEQRPERVISLSASLTEQIYDLGFGDRLVGVPQFISYPPEATQLDLCGTALLPDMEKMDELSADLVVAQAPLPEEAVEWLGEQGIPLVVLPVPTTTGELWQNLRDLSRVLGGEEDGPPVADGLIGSLERWLDNLEAVTSRQDQVIVAYLRQLDFNLATGDTLTGELLETAGFKNIAQNYTDWVYPKEEALSPEGKAAFAQVDLLFFDEADLTMKDLERNAFYQVLPATLQDQFLLVDSSALECQGLRMFEEIGKMAVAGFPESDIPLLDLTTKVPASRPSGEAPESDAPENGSVDTVDDSGLADPA